MGMISLEELQTRLMAFDTTSHRSNLELVYFMAEVLREAGLEVHVLPGAPDPHGAPKANLVASLGPKDTPGLMLAGHVDTVPVTDQKWSSDPYQLTRRGDRLYGRGTADMKSFVALAMHQAMQLAQSGTQRLKVPLQLAFTYDEEVGCQGAEHLMERLGGLDIPLPRMAVVGEPTNLEVFRLHKGICMVHVQVTGVEGHSSKPHLGANAIYPLGLLLQKLQEIAAERQAHTSQQALFEVPYTTLNVGTLNAGTAVNIIPNRAEMNFEYRTMPGEDPDYVFQQVQGFVKEVLLPEFRRQQPVVDIVVEKRHQQPPMLTPPGSEVERQTLAITQSVLGLPELPQAKAAPFYTEAAIYNTSGIPSVVCGPGDIDQAHRPDEYISVEQLERGQKWIGTLLEKVCL